MSAKLSAIKTERETVREDVVAFLEAALEEARQGEIAAIGVAIVRPSHHVNCGFTYFDNAGLLLGATALLQSRIIANMAPR